MHIACLEFLMKDQDPQIEFRFLIRIITLTTGTATDGENRSQCTLIWGNEMFKTSIWMIKGLGVL